MKGSMEESLMASMTDKYLVFIVLSGEWKNFHRRRLIENIADKFEKKGVIVCINRPIDLMTSPFRVKKAINRLKNGRFKEVKKNLWIICPITLLHDMITSKYNLTMLEKLNTILLKNQISNFIRYTLNIKKPSSFKKIIWIYSPFHDSYYSLFPNALKIYECYDEYRMNPDGSDNIDAIKKEKNVLSRANIVFVTSHMLLESRSKIHNRVFYIGNGIDTDFFADILKNSSEPIDLKGIPYPRILYVGNLRNWLDEEILMHSVDMLPEMQFLFLGPISNPKLAKILKSRKNVYFLGTKEYKDVPLYIKWSDVCIAPFRLNKFTMNVNPLKIYEYLYVGKPVVATPLPELLHLKHAVLIARDKNEFVEKIKIALRYSSDSEQIKIRRETAGKFSLRSIADYIYNILMKEGEKFL